MKQFILYTHDGSAVTAFIDLDNPDGQYARAFYSYDNQTWVLIMNAVTGITEQGFVINIPQAVVTSVPVAYFYVEMSPDNSVYSTVAEGVVKVLPVDSGTGTITGSISVDNFPSVYPLSTAQYNGLIAELQTIAANTMGGGGGGLTDAELRATPVVVNDGHPDALTDTELRAIPVDVNVVAGGSSTQELPLDVFSNLITGQRDNQVEVHFDDPNYSSYLTTTKNTTGDELQSNGQLRYSTGTNTNGSIKAVTTDIIKYRPMHETYASWTCAFITAGASGSWQRIGMFNDTDGVFVGYEGATFGVTWRGGSTNTFVAQASWLDKCDGLAGSRFTRSGVPEALDVTKLNLFRVRFGWLGAFGFIIEVLSPDWQWIPIYELHRPNQSSLPYLANADLPMSIDVGKSSGGATNYSVATNCWAGGTTSSKTRLSDPITDRSLVDQTRSVITGKTTAGGGGYVDVKVNPSGALVSDVSGSTVVTTATDLDIRNLTMALDSVTQTLRPSIAYSAPVVGPVTDQVIVSVSPGQRIRLLRNAGHIDPTAVDIYPNITLKIGSTTVFRDKMEPGLPWSETVCFEGADGEDLTISVDDTITVYLNMRYEVF